MRTVKEWESELDTDMRMVRYQIRYAQRTDGDPSLSFAVALKEARRLQSDLYRMAEVMGIKRDDIDKHHV